MKINFSYITFCSLLCFSLLVAAQRQAAADQGSSLPDVHAATSRRETSSSDTKERRKVKTKCRILANSVTKTYQAVENRVCFISEKAAIKAGYEKEGAYTSAR